MTDALGSAPSLHLAAAPDVDVVIIGAGISGIGAGVHLRQQCPHKRFLILDALESFGGTWFMHTYPGIRSDSDLYTFGYRFKPWIGPPIATADQILKYMGEVIEEYDLAGHIRYGWRVEMAQWSSAEAMWRLTARDARSGAPVVVRARFLWMCQGYYRHAEGYTPQWPGMADFKGPIIHPQTWPKGLDLNDKRVLVIGSGATAATLVPAIADDCAHVTMLQRSPTYFFPGVNRNELADLLHALGVDPMIVHDIARRKALHDQAELTRRAKAEPEAVKAELMALVQNYLGTDYDVNTHFNPRYRPWQQRVAFVPNGDLFEGIASGKAEVVTDEIVRFTQDGVTLKSGRNLEADIIVTATGFNLCALGDIEFTIDGAPLDFHDTITWRGMMFTGMPNMVWIFGYFRASWTLRVDLVGDFVCRLLNHMDKVGADVVEVRVPPEDADMPIVDWADPDDFNPGYLMRGQVLLPRRSAKPPWRHTQDYWREREEFPAISMTDPALVYRCVGLDPASDLALGKVPTTHAG